MNLERFALAMDGNFIGDFWTPGTNFTFLVFGFWFNWVVSIWYKRVQKPLKPMDSRTG